MFSDMLLPTTSLQYFVKLHGGLLNSSYLDPSLVYLQQSVSYSSWLWHVKDFRLIPSENVPLYHNVTIAVESDVN